MSQDLHRYDFVLSKLRHYGIPGKKLQTPLLLCIGVLGAARHRTNSTYIDLEALEKHAFPEQDAEILEVSELPDRAAEANTLQDEISRLNHLQAKKLEPIGHEKYLLTGTNITA